jgi:hypothetical protein
VDAGAGAGVGIGVGAGVGAGAGAGAGRVSCTARLPDRTGEPFQPERLFRLLLDSVRFALVYHLPGGAASVSYAITTATTVYTDAFVHACQPFLDGAARLPDRTDKPFQPERLFRLLLDSVRPFLVYDLLLLRGPIVATPTTSTAVAAVATVVATITTAVATTTTAVATAATTPT